MLKKTTAVDATDGAAFLNDSAAGRLIRAFDWNSTPLGPLARWPQSLKTLVSVAMGSAQPMFIAWGPQRTLIYNDAYAAILATKHPAALGRDFLEVWHEIRADLLPIVEQAYGGEPVHMDDIELWMERKGFREETHFAFSYTPVRDDEGAVAGFFCACQEITGQVIAERSLRESERRFRAVQDTSLDGFMILEAVRDAAGAIADFRWLHANEAAARIIGRPHGWFPGRWLLQEMPANREEGLFDIYARVVETGEPWQDEMRYAHEDVDVHLRITAAKAGDGFAVTFTDLSDRARAEAQLREAGERIQLALDAGAIIGTWVWDVTADRFTVDQAFADSFGLDPALGREGLSLEQVIATVHPDDRAGLTAAIDEAIARGGRYAHQYRVRRAEGRYYWIEANGRVDHLPGSRVRFPGVLLDVEARRAVEAERDQALALLRAFADAVPGVVYAKDREGRMLVSNRGTTELIGKPPEEYLGRTDREFLDDKAQADAVMATDARIMASGEAEQVEEVVDFPGGRRAVWLSTKAPFRDAAGKVVGLIGSSVDITERHRAELALQALNADLERQVIERSRERGLIWLHSFDLLSVIDLASAAFDTVNPAWKATLGWEADEMERRPYTDFLHPDDRAASVAAFEQVRRGDPVLRFENRYRRKDGGWRWLSWVAVPEGGKLYSITRDMTAEREQADALAQAQEQLRQSQKLEAMGQLTGGVAHDFNNLLTPIVGALDLLQRRGNQDERTGRLIAGALQSAERARTLVQRLLAFARRQPLQPVAVDLGRLVTDMAELVASTSGPRIRLDVEIAPDLPPVLADANQIEMALLNLAVNARDAMPDGGCLTIAAGPEVVATGHGTGLPPGHYVRLSVSDTGIGMDEATRRRAVEPFFTTKGIGRGTGLGLSMVHGLAAQLGGSLVIRSKPGLGTTVELWLPVADEAVRPGPGGGESLRGASGTVLLVDDEATVRDATAHMLSDLGYAVVEAASADEALRLMNAGLVPDLLVTDHLMPGMTGTELATALRATWPELRIMVISGYAENSGIDPTLPRLNKPFRQDELAAALAETGSL